MGQKQNPWNRSHTRTEGVERFSWDVAQVVNGSANCGCWALYWLTRYCFWHKFAARCQKAHNPKYRRDSRPTRQTHPANLNLYGRKSCRNDDDHHKKQNYCCTRIETEDQQQQHMARLVREMNCRICMEEEEAASWNIYDGWCELWVDGMPSHATGLKGRWVGVCINICGCSAYQLQWFVELFRKLSTFWQRFPFSDRNE